MNVLILLSKALSVYSFVHVGQRSGTSIGGRRQSSLQSSHLRATIERQSDEKYGRGISHISADISEGEIIAYQDGTWFVDGNEVGDGSDPIIKYMLVDTIQIVWTHNCEHGVINGFHAIINDDRNKAIEQESGYEISVGSVFEIGSEYVQCGPEQVVAKIPTSSNAADNFVSQAKFIPEKEMLRG